MLRLTEKRTNTKSFRFMEKLSVDRRKLFVSLIDERCQNVSMMSFCASKIPMTIAADGKTAERINP